MKIYFFFVLFFFSLFVKSQDLDKANLPKNELSFEEGKFTFDGGAGFCVYKLKLHYQIGKNQLDTTGAAGGVNFPFKFEYGVNDKLGIGARFNFSNFADKPDTTYHPTAIPKSNAIDFGIIFNLHLIVKEKFDLPLGINLGYSRIKIQSNDLLHNIAKSEGMNFGLSLTPRFYFSENVGVYINLGYMSYDYPKFIYSNDKDPDLNSTFQIKSTAKAKGVNFGIGLITKF